MLADTKSILTACNVVDASDDAIINCVEVRAVDTVAGKRWKVSVVYDFGPGEETVRNSHKIPLYADKQVAIDAANDVAAYISKNLGGFNIPVKVR